MCSHPRPVRRVKQRFVAKEFTESVATASHTFLSAAWRTSSSAAPGLAQDAHPPLELCGQGETRRVAGAAAES